jgi:hypothetical protein
MIIFIFMNSPFFMIIFFSGTHCGTVELVGSVRDGLHDGPVLPAQVSPWWMVVVHGYFTW